MRRPRELQTPFDGLKAFAWFAGARRKFTGPVRTIEFDEALGIIEEAPVGPAPAPGS